MPESPKTAAGHPARKTITVRQRVLFGCLGAVTPLVLNLLVVDHLALENLTLVAFAGYAIRVAALLFLGGLVAYFYKSESDLFKIFQLGLAAPALVTGMMNGANSAANHTTASLRQSVQSVASIFSVPSVYAQTSRPQQKLKKFTLPKESATEEFFRGLTGARAARIWFIIVSRHASLGEAEKLANRINQGTQGLHAEVYEPYGGSQSYPVVIGAGLTRAEAERLRQKAIAAGYPDANVWTPPAAGAQGK